MAKKSYNPFKMRGSWIGAGIVLIFSIIFIIKTSFFYTVPTAEFMICEVLNWCTGIEFAGLFQAWIYSFIVTIITGFLVGWAIHSLIRSLK